MASYFYIPLFKAEGSEENAYKALVGKMCDPRTLYLTNLQFIIKAIDKYCKTYKTKEIQFPLVLLKESSGG